MPLLQHTVAPVNRIFAFFEELMGCRFPYASYRQVFVDQAPDDVTAYAGLSILSMSLLHHKRVLDLVPGTRQALASAIAQQFFGCLVGWMVTVGLVFFLCKKIRFYDDL